MTSAQCWHSPSPAPGLGVGAETRLIPEEKRKPFPPPFTHHPFKPSQFFLQAGNKKNYFPRKLYLTGILITVSPERKKVYGVCAVVRPLHSPPTKTNRIRIPERPLSDFRNLEIIPDDAAAGGAFGSHKGEPGSSPGGVVSRIFASGYCGVFRFPSPCIPALLDTHFASPSFALKPLGLEQGQARVRDLPWPLEAALLPGVTCDTSQLRRIGVHRTSPCFQPISRIDCTSPGARMLRRLTSRRRELLAGTFCEIFLKPKRFSSVPLFSVKNLKRVHFTVNSVYLVVLSHPTTQVLPCVAPRGEQDLFMRLTAPDSTTDSSFLLEQKKTKGTSKATCLTASGVDTERSFPSIPDLIAPTFSHVGIVLDDAARWSAGFLGFPHPHNHPPPPRIIILTLHHTHLVSSFIGSQNWTPASKVKKRGSDTGDTSTSSTSSLLRARRAVFPSSRVMGLLAQGLGAEALFAVHHDVTGAASSLGRPFAIKIFLFILKNRQFFSLKSFSPQNFPTFPQICEKKCLLLNVAD
ncbi:hypothetical protein PR048_000880 [Dryococelus australis]|uniref:Uncharacterized protein n=1 Tax=Dryococelus australis TaxID=614101 RepID=A0ABQ9IFX1_9NEOP|nr:hypothetical protein PR048_000880 [Dryococelus australis]